MATLQRQTLGGGSMKFIDAAVTDEKYFCLVVNADCVFTKLETVGGQNLLTIYGLTGKTVKQGMLIPQYNGDYIAAVTPASGSVIGYAE